LFTAHEDLAESLNDRARLGMFCAWLGFAIGTYRAVRDPLEIHRYHV